MVMMALNLRRKGYRREGYRREGCGRKGVGEILYMWRGLQSAATTDLRGQELLPFSFFR
jgi:hypothetical protein